MPSPAANPAHERVRTLLASGALDLPLPGRGATAERFARLHAIGREDLVAARLVEAHTDAVAVLDELGARQAVAPGQLWGVWAADPPGAGLRAEPGPADGWTLSGAKPWCSGATLCDRALVTAHADDGYRLFAVDPRDPGFSVAPSRWHGPGMAGSDTRDLDADAVPAVAVGAPDDYLDRDGFWWGAAGVAAVWLGGAARVAEALERAAARHGTDLVLVALGRVETARHAAWCTLQEVARLADDGGCSRDAAHLAAARARAAVEEAVETTVLQTARATGPAPLATDEAHARHVADLQVYVRQSHGDRDLAVLGRLALATLPTDGTRPSRTSTGAAS